jgi:hypothetical protein
MGYCFERRDVIERCLEESGRRLGVPESMLAELKTPPKGNQGGQYR